MSNELPLVDLDESALESVIDSFELKHGQRITAITIEVEEDGDSITVDFEEDGDSICV